MEEKARSIYCAKKRNGFYSARDVESFEKVNEQKRIEIEADRILRLFSNSGAQIVQPNVLQRADTLLDLYGEDIRARAYVTSDSINGEMMLRPDFTVPIVKTHMTGVTGNETARYAYCGKVFRRQEKNSERASEYLQVGYEIFDRTDVIKSDTDVFCIIKKALGDLPLRVATGDIGILMTAVSSLKTTSSRQKALLRHLWRPQRFLAILEKSSLLSSAFLILSPDIFDCSAKTRVASCSEDISREKKATFPPSITFTLPTSSFDSL